MSASCLETNICTHVYTHVYMSHMQVQLLEVKQARERGEKLSLELRISRDGESRADARQRQLEEQVPAELSNLEN